MGGIRVGTRRGCELQPEIVSGGDKLVKEVVRGTIKSKRDF
jgi:hypothetical protein